MRATFKRSFIALVAGFSLAVAVAPGHFAYAIDTPSNQLEWGVRHKFNEYAGQAETTEGASVKSTSPVVYAFTPGESNLDVTAKTASLSSTGKLHWEAYGGMLNVTLKNFTVKISGAEGQLLADYKSKDLSGTWHEDTQRPCVTFDTSVLTWADNSVSANAVPTAVTAECAEKVFAGFYQEGAALDPLTFTISKPATDNMDSTSADTTTPKVELSYPEGGLPESGGDITVKGSGFSIDNDGIEIRIFPMENNGQPVNNYDDAEYYAPTLKYLAMPKSAGYQYGDGVVELKADGSFIATMKAPAKAGKNWAVYTKDGTGKWGSSPFKESEYTKSEIAYNTTVDEPVTTPVAKPTLTVSKAPLGDRWGTVTITGRGFQDAEPGVYLGIGPKNESDFYTAHSHGKLVNQVAGEDNMDTKSAWWIAPSSNTQCGSLERCVKMKPDGSFTVNIRFNDQIVDKNVEYVSFASKAHGRGTSDKSQNAMSNVIEFKPVPQPQLKVTKADCKGGEVTVNGTGFTAADNGINIALFENPEGSYRDSYAYAKNGGWVRPDTAAGANPDALGKTEFTLNDDGSFTLNIKVPAYEKDKEYVIMTTRAHYLGGIEWDTRENILYSCQSNSNPAITVDKMEVKPGEEISFTATGFSEDSDVEFWVHSDPIKVGAARVKNGKAIFTWKVPVNFAEGRHRVIAQQGNNSVHTEFKVLKVEKPIPVAKPSVILASTGSQTAGLVSVALLLLAFGVVVVKVRAIKK